MRKFSKGISLILAICMIIAMVPAAFAADEATTVTVSMKAEELGSVNTAQPYALWKNRNDVRVASDTNITRLNWDCACKLLRGDSVSTNNLFSFDVQVVDGTYGIEITPITTGLGCSYNVFVDGQFAGRVDTRDDSVGTNAFVIASSAQKLNTLALTPDEDGWVNIKLQNVSTSGELADPGNFRMGFANITLTPVSGEVKCEALNENISDAELYVGKTLDFVISPVMSDGSTRYFDTNDANSYITASVADGSSVTITDTVMKADGLHGKINAVSDEEATINVAVTLGGVTTNYTINITPIAALVPVETTVSMFDRAKYEDTTHVISTTNIASGNGELSSGHTIVWEDGNTEYVADKTTMNNFREIILKNAASGATVNHGVYKWPIGLSSSDAKFTFRTKLADGAYNVSIVPVMSLRGCTYGVWVGGQYAGSVDTYENHAGDWSNNSYANASVSLNTLDLTGDAEGWVEVTIKKLSVPAGNTTGYCSLGFKDITFTPAEDLEVSSLTENISSTDIYNGETYDFHINAVMNDGQIHKFDTSNTADKIEASVPAGSAVKISDTVMKEDGLYGKITGTGDDEKAKITITTTINGEEYTNTIDVISFATEVKTPETVVVSMNIKDTYDVVHNKPDGMNFTSASTLTWGEGDKVRLVKDKTHLTAFREYPARAYISYGVIADPVAETKDSFTFKVRAAAGTYKVGLTYAETVGGCVYDVIIDGTNVGSVDCSGTSTSWYEPRDVATPADLSNVTLTPDEEGWVEITLKWKSGGYVGSTSTTACLFFKNITLTPTEKVYVAAEHPYGEIKGLVKATGCEAGEVSDVAFGETITLEATEDNTYKFLYWMNLSNNMYISEETTLDVDVTSNIAIAAVYTSSDVTRYDYFTDSGVRIATYSEKPVTEPAIPARIGYDIGNVTWTNARSHKIDNYEAYVPDYSTATATTSNATLNGETKLVSYNEEVTLSSDASNFSYWTKNNKVVSYDRSYTFFVWGSEEVTAILEGALAAAEKKPAVVLFSIGNDHMLELVGFDGIEVVEKGILFAESGKPTIGSTIAKAKSNTDSKQFAASSTYTVARAYVVYRDGAALKVIYSD